MESTHAAPFGAPLTLLRLACTGCARPWLATREVTDRFPTCPFCGDPAVVRGVG